MSSDESPNVPAPRDRREAVREKAQQVQARQSRSRIVRRTVIGVGGIAVVAAAAVAVTFAVTSSASKPNAQPANVTGDGFAITSVSGVAAATAAAAPDSDAAVATPSATPSPTTTSVATVDIRIYVDYLSAGAKDFQVANVQQLSKWVTQDAATLTYYPVAMLTAKSNGTKYSLRAASAAACVATHSPDTFFAFNNNLLAKAPDQDSDGLTDSALADLAQASGVDDPKTVRSCIEGENYAVWAKNATDRALAGLPDTKGVTLTGTPMVLVNGTPYVGALDDAKEFAQFVLTIANDTYYKTATPTPTPTVTP
ncbi:MAG: thioredoxin domain-containing protein [Actinobacteria bacterium]|nr:thioredoxin domain-containing protein [Actinomycetota bacterium]